MWGVWPQSRLRYPDRSAPLIPLLPVLPLKEMVVFPQMIGAVGWSGMSLVLAGGLLYTAGGLVYALRRPNPFPRVFGYHEIFHVLVVAAVCLQYAVVAFWVVHPD